MLDLDKHTFGDSMSAVNLISILQNNDDEKCAKSISRILSKYFKAMKSLSEIKDKDTRETAYLLWRNHYLDWIQSCEFPTLVETHAKCVVVGLFRKYRRLNYNLEETN